MPWSKVVRPHLLDGPVQTYALKEVERSDASERTSLPSSGEPEYMQGFQDGEVKGFAEGEAYGFAKGKVQGLAIGEAKGFADGKAKGFTQGRAEGLAEGEATGKELREEEVKTLEQTGQILLHLIEDFKCLTQTYVAEAERDLVQVALAVAQKVIRKELLGDDASFVNMIQAALKKVTPIEAVTLRVHPEDLDRLTQKSPEILEGIHGIGNIHIEPDARLTPGDSVVETDERIVDLRPETQIAEIQKKLLQSPRGES